MRLQGNTGRIWEMTFLLCIASGWKGLGLAGGRFEVYPLSPENTPALALNCHCGICRHYSSFERRPGVWRLARTGWSMDKDHIACVRHYLKDYDPKS